MVAAERRIHGERAAAPGPLALPRDGALALAEVAVEERPPLASLHDGARGSSELAGEPILSARRRA
jgi:hypothetical protein